MKRIALFISSLQKGGSERVMANLAEYFHNKNYEVILVTQYKKEIEYELLPEIKRVYSEPEEQLLTGSRIRDFMLRYRTLRNIWKEYKPDTILSFVGKNNMMAIMTSLGLPCKVAVSVRAEPTVEYETKLFQVIAKVLFHLADGVAMQTKQACNFLPTLVRKKAKVLSNPLNPQFIRERYVGPREDIIVAVGRLIEIKNQKMLIHAFAKIADEFPNMRLIIYGEGEDRLQLEQLVQEKALQDRIELPGSVSDVSEKIGKARIFALTSNAEGMPNSLMEAMALGLPVVSTDCPCGGAATLIQHGVNGLLVPVGDAYALADAFRKILNDRDLEQSLGEQAYQITSELHPDKVNQQWEQFLANL